MKEVTRMSHHHSIVKFRSKTCDNCGKAQGPFVKTLIGAGWEYWCWDCLDEDDEGFVVQLS